MIGQKIGSYEVVGKLGEGGMGEVYRARDTRLHRDVAIKVLHAPVAADPDRLRRFQQEAQAVATLNHPNILTIFEVGSHDGHPFLATELLEGETLRHRLDAGALPFSKAIDYARQAAAGLAAAHAKGLVHRDIKPENLFVTSDGRVKVLDFGLVKAQGPKDHEEAATILAAGTEAGVILGTVGYMSPEQVRAQPVDQRTDIFSLGIVLYEMLTGRRPFAGDSAVETMNAILSADPPEIPASGRALPPAAAPIVRHCLEKNRDERFQSARDLSFALQSISGSTGSAIAPVPEAVSRIGRNVTARRGWLALAAAGIAGAVVGAGALLLFRPAPATLDLSAHRFTPFATDAEAETKPAWSPDGRSIAYLKGTQVVVRTIDDGEATPVNTPGISVRRIFWFPDNNRLGLLGNSGGVWAVSRAGGDPDVLQRGPKVAAALSPDGRTLALWVLTTESSQRTASLWFASPPNAEPKKYEHGLKDLPGLTPIYLEYSPDGRRLAVSGYVPDPSVWIVDLDERGAATRAPTRILAAEKWPQPPNIAWRDSRTLVMSNDHPTQQPGLSLVDVERGSVTRITAGVERLHDPTVSPDGRRIAFTAGTADYDLVSIPLDGALVTDVLATSRHEFGAVWMPSKVGRELVYITNKSGEGEIRLRRMDDGSERVIVGSRSFPGEPMGDLGAVAVSPDGTRVVFGRFDKGRARVWVAPVAGGAPVRVGSGDENDWMGAWSADGKEIVYASWNASGRSRLLAQRLGSSEPPRVLIDAIPTVFGCLLEVSPQGDAIAHDSPSGLSLINVDGSSPRVLTPQRANAIAWAPNGRTIYALLRDTPGISAIDVATGQTRVVRALGAAMTFGAPVSPALRLTVDATGTSLLTTISRERSDLWLMELGGPKQ